MGISQITARRHPSVRRGAAVGLAAAAVLSFAAPANAATTPISGSTSWGPCNWYTSNNVRYTTVANKTVRVRLSDTGKLGVKMRTLNVNTGGTSAIRYYPPLDTWQNLGSFSSKNAPFRLQFTCVNPRKSGDSPETDFAGSLDH
jgi:hypothetical protein